MDMMKDSSLITARRFSVAPMMEWTDRHCRFFHRLLTRRALLYTEMLTTGAIIHGDRARLLKFDPAEHPVAIQLAETIAKRQQQEIETMQELLTNL